MRLSIEIESVKKTKTLGYIEWKDWPSGGEESNCVMAIFFFAIA